MRKFFRSFRKDQSGATAIEYAVLISLMAVFMLGAFGGVQTGVSTVVDSVASALGGGGGTTTTP